VGAHGGFETFPGEKKQNRGPMARGDPSLREGKTKTLQKNGRLNGRSVRGGKKSPAPSFPRENHLAPPRRGAGEKQKKKKKEENILVPFRGGPIANLP